MSNNEKVSKSNPVLKKYQDKIEENKQHESWEEIFKKYSDSHPLDLEQVRYWFVPLIDWMNENYPIKNNSIEGKEIVGDDRIEKLSHEYLAPYNKPEFTNKEIFTPEAVAEGFVSGYEAASKNHSSNTLDQLEKWVVENTSNVEDQAGVKFFSIDSGEILDKIKSLKK